MGSLVSSEHGEPRESAALAFPMSHVIGAFYLLPVPVIDM